MKEQINNKDLLYSTGNYIQYIVTNYNGKVSRKRIYIYKWENKYTEDQCLVDEGKEAMWYTPQQTNNYQALITMCNTIPAPGLGSVLQMRL